MLRKTDLLWLLAYPLYQIIGTVRHEGSHALAAVLHGRTLLEFVFWPSLLNGRFVWGYVSYTGSNAWLITAAPYLIDLLTFAIFFVLLWRVRLARHSVWLNLVIIGLLSPLINSAYNYSRQASPGSDVAELLRVLPDGWVHGYFGAMLLLYLIGLVLIFRSSAARRG